MRYILLGAGATLAMLSVLQPANAQGVRLSGTATQTFRADNNINFGGSNLTLRSRTRLTASLISETETTRIAATTGTTAGLALSGGGSFSLAPPSLRLSFRNERSRTSSVSGFVSYNKSPISFEEIQPDLTVLDESADRTTIRGGLSANGRLSQLTRAAINFNAANIDFDPTSAELVPYTDYNLTGGLSYLRTPQTTYTLNAAVGSFDGDGITDSKSLSGRLTFGIDTELDNRTGFNGSIGLAYVNTEETDGGIRSDDWTLSLLFDAGVDYALSDGSLSLGISQSVGPSATGQLALNTGLNATYTQQITEAQTIGLSATYNRQEVFSVANSDPETFFTLSPTYTRQLNRAVEMQAALNISRNNDGDISSGVSVTFEQPFSFPLR